MYRCGQISFEIAHEETRRDETRLIDLGEELATREAGSRALDKAERLLKRRREGYVMGMVGFKSLRGKFGCGCVFIVAIYFRFSKGSISTTFVSASLPPLSSTTNTPS